MLMLSFAVPLQSVTAGHIANIVKGYALAIGVVFAIGFVLCWWRRHVSEVALDRAVRARAVWRQYLGSALEHPELADPAPTQTRAPHDGVRYRAFVGILLASAEEILALEPSESWRQTLTRSLAPHGTYLRSAEFRESDLPSCSRDLRRIIEKVTRA